MAGVLLWSSAVRVHDSHAYRKTDVTREHISRLLELREIFLSFQTGSSLVSSAVVCAFLDSISDLEPSSVITEPRYHHEQPNAYLQAYGSRSLHGSDADLVWQQCGKKTELSVQLPHELLHGAVKHSTLLQCAAALPHDTRAIVHAYFLCS